MTSRAPAMRALLFAAATAAAALACSHFQSTRDRTLCPESREMVCLTALNCTMDESRGCRVCQCSTGVPQGGRPEDSARSNMPRDRNQPP